MKRPVDLPAEGVEVLRALREAAGGLVLMSHVRADADAWGSLLGLGHLLRDAGRPVHPVAGEDRDGRYCRLPAGGPVLKPDAAPSAAEAPTAVVLDTASETRLTPGGEKLLAGRTVVRIDHHRAAAPFGNPRWVDPASPATAVMVLRLADAAGWRLSPAAADCLYAGLLGDTGGFRYANTTPEALEAAADLARRGARVHSLGFHMLDLRSRAAVELHRVALDRARWSADQRIVGSWIGPGDYERAAGQPDDIEGLVESLRAVEDVRIAVLIDRPPGAGRSHVSWRTVGFDAVALAAPRGGGGHPGAAGADVDAPPEKALKEVMADAEAALEQIEPRIPAARA